MSSPGERMSLAAESPGTTASPIEHHMVLADPSPDAAHFADRGLRTPFAHVRTCSHMFSRSARTSSLHRPVLSAPELRVLGESSRR
jgi:hypothetical protein